MLCSALVAALLLVAAPAVSARPTLSDTDLLSGALPEVTAPAYLRPMATVAGVTLTVPAVRFQVVGFHQASSAASLPMVPADGFGAMPLRGRGTSATSAVDVAVPAGGRVVAPVDGTVVEVRPYLLYGQHDDVLVVVQVAGSDRQVRLLHLQEVTVAVGDRLVRGDRIGVARLLPFASQVDAFHAGPAGPHVHLEVR